MKPLPRHRGTAIEVDRTSIDTDIIIPAKHCLRVTRTGFAEHLFEGWRSDPDFSLNDSSRRDASVLIAGRDFGTGSSREAAVWALQEWGFEVVVSSRFGDIFYTNCGKNGMLAAQIEEQPLQQLMCAVHDQPDTVVSVELSTKTLSWDDGNRRGEAIIDIDDFTCRRLIEGLDDIDITLLREAQISAHEQANNHYLPRRRPVA